MTCNDSKPSRTRIAPEQTDNLRSPAACTTGAAR